MIKPRTITRLYRDDDKTANSRTDVIVLQVFNLSLTLLSFWGSRDLNAKRMHAGVAHRLDLCRGRDHGIPSFLD